MEFVDVAAKSKQLNFSISASFFDSETFKNQIKSVTVQKIRSNALVTRVCHVQTASFEMVTVK